MREIKFTAKNLELTKSLEEYAREKIGKYKELLEEANLIEVEMINKKSHSGVDTDFKLEINVNMPKAFIKVEDFGSDLYALIDKLEVTLARRLKRYKDLRSRSLLHTASRGPLPGNLCGTPTGSRTGCASLLIYG